MTKKELLDSVGKKLDKLNCISAKNWKILEIELLRLISRSEEGNKNIELLKGEYSSRLGTKYKKSLASFKEYGKRLDKLVSAEMHITNRDSAFLSDLEVSGKTIKILVSNLEKEYEIYTTNFKSLAKGKSKRNRAAEVNSYTTYSIINRLKKYTDEKLPDQQLYNIARPIIAFIESEPLGDLVLTHGIDVDKIRKRYGIEKTQFEGQKKNDPKGKSSGPVYASFPLLHAFCESM